jgi:hypothetical protein
MLYQLSSRLNNSRVVLARLEIETAHQLAEYKLEHKEEVRTQLTPSSLPPKQQAAVMLSAAYHVGPIMSALSNPQLLSQIEAEIRKAHQDRRNSQWMKVGYALPLPLPFSDPLTARSPRSWIVLPINILPHMNLPSYCSAAGVIGGVAIGLTGGLAAPLVAAGVGAIFGTGQVGTSTL